MKPFVKTNRNNFNDAIAIAEAGSRATMRFVSLKTTEQLELQAAQRMRPRWVHERTADIHQLRAFLEYGIVTPLGRETFRAALVSELGYRAPDVSSHRSSAST